MTDPSRYGTAADRPGRHRGMPRAAWTAGAVVALVALLIVVILLAGGHDPSQFRHG